MMIKLKSNHGGQKMGVRLVLYKIKQVFLPRSRICNDHCGSAKIDVSNSYMKINIFNQKLYLFVIGMAALMSSPVLASELKFITHSSEQQTKTDEKGELRGLPGAGRRAFVVELVREIMKIVKVPLKIEQVPLARGMKYVQESDDYVFFNVTRTPERESTVKWVGPIESTTAYFYERKNESTGIKVFSDAKKVGSISVLRGGVHEDILKGQGFENIHPTNSYVQSFKMLQAGRVKLAIANDRSIDSLLKMAAISPADIQQTSVVALQSTGYLAFSKNISDDIVLQWQLAFDQVVKNGKYKEIYNKYYD